MPISTARDDDDDDRKVTSQGAVMQLLLKVKGFIIQSTVSFQEEMRAKIEYKRWKETGPCNADIVCGHYGQLCISDIDQISCERGYLIK